ncbi:lytic murein transglycosylase [Yoonia maricola]|uniref:Lytic murein transglycosylase n=1 Tax=Yoonia maricola TaxID=420999 RepID=A0A2M8WQA9_9RHOB|nr:lytic murein transglycosylase [Yoonia maricola]PJI93094.1 lytic murein transglycosylase [Yoonia maricola]
MHRRQFIASSLSTLALPSLGIADASGFPNWIAGFRARARAAGISDTTFNAAFTDVRYLPDSIERDRNQAEFVRPLADYMSTAVSDTRVSNGREMVQRYAGVLSQIEARFDVEPQVVVAVWGMESNYGQRRGDTPLISTLATLAYEGRRGAFFESQLIAALKIVQNGDVAPRNMTGSWAGAMGHTQFMPTSYEAYAVDFTGDGRRDIWADDPSDALASTAAYFRRFGWRKGQPWGVEVRLPQGFDFGQTGRTVTRRPSDWARLGVLGTDGRAVPDYGDATLATPTGAGGPAFLLFRNYDVIGRYNNAEAYIIGVGHLSDRIRGAGPLQVAFPADERRLRRAERRELQQRLTDAGFSTQGVDGRIGPNSRAAIRGYQRSVGLPPDGHPSLGLLQRLR